MPLPDNPGMPWPPTAAATVHEHFERWAAWYGGNPDELAAVYGDPGVSRNMDARAFFDVDKPSLRQRFQRLFWGAPVPAGEQRTKLHIPVAGDIAAISADLLYAEPPQVTVPEGSPETADRIEDYVEDGLFTALREGAEIGAAMGGVYLRVVWDDQVRERPWLTACGPELVVPEWRWDRLAAATFWRDITPDGSRDVVRHLERHEPGVILHGVYVGTRDKLGMRVPLTEYPDTADLADALDGEDAMLTGIDDLTCAYIPNMRPARIWRGNRYAANFGRSDFSGVEALFDSIDEAWSSWMRDLRLSKARLIVPQNALTNLGKGKGALYDTEREVMVGLDMGPNPMTGQSIEKVQFDIRWEAHKETLLTAIETAVRDAGYSMQTLSGTGDVAMTATEVASRERRSLITRGRKIQYQGPELRDMVEVLLAVDAAKFGPDGVQPGDVQVDWPKWVFVDPMDTASTVQLLRDSGVVSQATAIEMIHPDWDAARVRAEMERLATEDSGGGYISVQDAAEQDDQPDPADGPPDGPPTDATDT